MKLKVSLSLLICFFSFNLLAEIPNAIQCEDFLKNLPKEYRRGHLEVPEDYENPNGPKIKIFYFTKMKEGQMPVVHFNGGPQSGNVAYASFASIEDRYDFGMIFADQRGTRCSGEMPVIKDIESARRASLYGTAQIVLDHEAIRKHLLGENTPWTLFGQSFGGFVVERYITMFPNSIVNAHNAGGIMYDFDRIRVAEMLRSQVQANKKFFELFPGSEEKLKWIASKLSNDKCFYITGMTEHDKICGKGIVSELGFGTLVSESSWGQFAKFLDETVNCTHDSCLFNEDFSLNQKFWTAYEKNNPGNIDFWWGPETRGLNNIAIFRQDFPFMDKAAANSAITCKAALEDLRKEGVDLDREIPINICHTLEQTTPIAESRMDVSNIFLNTPIPNPFKVANLKKGLLQNKNMKYFIYNGDMDHVYSNPNVDKRDLPKNQTQYIRFENRGHWGYLEESLFWQNLTGKMNRKLFGEGAIVSVNGTNAALTSVRMFGGTKNLGDLTSAEATNELVYVGKANEALDTQTASRLKGKFALIERGEAPFATKVQNVEAAGAVGFVIINNVKIPGDAFKSSLGDYTTNIPGVMASYQDGEKIKSYLRKNQTVTLKFTYEP